MIGIYILATHHKLKFNLKVLFGAVCMCGVTTLYVLANKLTTAANTIVLQYSAPVWIIIMSALILHKKPKKAEVITILFVFAGIICFFVDSLGAGNMAGNIVALVSGIFYAGVFMLNAMPGGAMHSKSSV